MSEVYLSVALAEGEGAEATREAWLSGLRVPSEVVVRRARNAAIRASAGEFVVATKAGVTPSVEVMALVNARGLDAGAIYRADILEERDGVRWLWSREGCSRVSADGVRLVEDKDICSGDGSVVLGKGWFPVEGDGCYRWVEAAAQFEVVRPEWALAELVLEVECGPSAGGSVALEVVNPAGVVRFAATVEGRRRVGVTLPEELRRERLTLRVAGGGLALAEDLRVLNLRVWDLRWRSPWEGGAEGGPRIILQGAGFPGTRLHVRALKVEDVGGGEFSLTLRYRVGREGEAPEAKLKAQEWGAPPALPASTFLHVNGAEDFVMMARARWMDLRGWPEIAIAAEFVETLFCYSAHYAGLREVVLAEPFRRGARGEGVVCAAVDEARVRGWVTQMRRLGAPMIFNRGNWGS